MALKRPNRLKYAIYTEEGKKKYAKDMRAYKAAQAEAKRKAEAKKPAAKKPVAKKPVAKKPATKTPTAKKPVAKKPPVKKPVAKKPAAKKPAAKKPATSTAAKGKTLATGKSAPKRKPFEAQKRGRGRPRKQQPTTNQAPKKNQTLKIIKEETEKGIKKVGGKLNEGKKAITNKVDEVTQVKQRRSKAPQTTQQKAVSKVYKGTKGLVKRGLKGAKNLLKIRNAKALGKQGLGGLAAAGAAHVVNKRVDRAFAASKGMTLKEFEKARQSEVGKRGLNRLRPKNIGNTINALRGKGKPKKEESSVSRNIKKQKKANTTPSSGLKIKKTQYSSSAAKKKQNFGGATGTKTADKRFGTFREGSKENRKLQLERQDGKKETYSRKVSKEAEKTKTKPVKSSGKKMHAIEKRNRKIFGDAHVERLKRQHEAFKRRRKKK